MDYTRRIGLDIVPKEEGITKTNFFDYQPEKDTKYLVVGTPLSVECHHSQWNSSIKVLNLQVVLRLSYQEHLKELVFKIN
jgi:hypothetical protein